MKSTDDRAPEEQSDAVGKPLKRAYVTPKLERLGTIRELTHGLGSNNQFDGGHPPGQNKSIL
jgi:hypothetical protein